MSSVKNYTEQGGDRTVIGGTLEIVAGGQVVGLFTPAAFQADSTATTIAGLVTDLNLLLAKLKVSGLMEPTNG